MSDYPSQKLLKFEFWISKWCRSKFTIWKTRWRRWWNVTKNSL